MRAFAIIDESASPALTELDVPEPEPNEVRVRVRAASVNGFDLAVAAGMTKQYMEHRYPLVLGRDFAGEVDAVGADVAAYAAGDRVFGTVTKPFVRDGSFAEYVTAPTDVGLAKLPDSVSFIDAAALGLAGSAARGVVASSELGPGETVLVVGATGGVGTQAVQLAAAAGARVVATAHTDQERQLVTDLGAESTVDHTADLVADVRRLAPGGVDVVIHLAGDTSIATVLRAGGRFVSTLLGSPDQVDADDAVVVPVYANPTPELLGELATSHEVGETTVHIEGVYPLERASEALERFASGTLGKLVIAIDPTDPAQ
jgi:NADPH2:quinone reductase